MAGPSEAAQAARRSLPAELRVPATWERSPEHVLEPFGKLATIDLRVIFTVELLLPECARVFMRVLRELDERRVSAAREQDRLTFGPERRAVALEQELADPARRHYNVRFRRREHGAGGQPHEIAGERELAGVVKVVDAPD